MRQRYRVEPRLGRRNSLILESQRVNIPSANPSHIDWSICMLTRNIAKILSILAGVVILNACLYGIGMPSDVLLVSNSETSSHVSREMALVAEFYGVNLRSLSAGKPRFNDNLKKALREPDLGAIVIDAGVLSSIDPDVVMRSMKVPCLVVNAGPQTDARVLKLWSKGVVIDCTNVEGGLAKGIYRVSDTKDITFELAGQKFPFSDKSNGKRYKLNVDKEKNYRVLFEIGTDGTEDYRPFFIKVPLSGKEVFFHSGKEEASGAGASLDKNVDRFFEVAPLMVFIRYSLGKRCWFPAGYYANFTIDDPFLIEPYGNLNYQFLLAEMERWNFHTTIAYIPWNFDRSEKEVVRLFLEHPQRYSICIHGNNHDHKDFSPERPPAEQDRSVKQAIARMERFRTQTGIPYDRVMVFPRAIASLETLKMLKRYDYLSTVNQDNIPLGAER